jgi:transposase
MVDLSEVVIYIDNSRVHTAHNVIEALEILGIKIIFAPPYCPQLNPIELLFRSLKIRLATQQIATK